MCVVDKVEFLCSCFGFCLSEFGIFVGIFISCSCCQCCCVGGVLYGVLEIILLVYFGGYCGGVGDWDDYQCYQWVDYGVVIVQGVEVQF